MRLIFILTICSSFVFNVSAQIANISGIGNQVLKVNKYVDIEGSPYLYQDWRAGSVTDNKGKKFTDIFIRYDAYSDEIQINQSGEVMILNQDLYPSFTIMFPVEGSNDVLIQNFSNNASYAQLPKGYYQILATGEIQVLKKYQVKFIEDNVANYGTTATIKRFQSSEIIYLVYGSSLEMVKLSNKTVLDGLGAKRIKAEEFLKKEKLKIKKESDLLQLIDYLNQF